MKKGKSRVMVVVVLSMAFAGCEQMLMPKPSAATPTEVFDCLWHGVDERYSMFDVKGVEWQEVYDTMRPKVWDGMGDDSLFAVCAAMLSLLRDGHVNLYGGYDVSHSERVYERFYEEGQIDIDAVVLGYLGADYRTAGGIAYNVLSEGRVVYMRYSSFNGSASVGVMRHILQQYPRAQGMIFDIRGNGGGSVEEVINVLRIFASHGQQLYSSQIKTGVGHEEFSTPQATYAPISEDNEVYRGKIVVLTDRGSYSAASLLALCCMAYPEVTLMGDTTSGGLGLPATYLLPNGWRYRIPVTRLLTPSGINLEEGVAPDRVVLLDKAAARDERKDNIIETATLLICDGQ